MMLDIGQTERADWMRRACTLIEPANRRPVDEIYDPINPLDLCHRKMSNNFLEQPGNSVP
jgi:hypothetical protein